MKKILSLILAMVMIVGLLAACGNKTQEPTDPKITNPTPVGMFVLNVGAAVNVSYDADGLVIKVEGVDDEGVLMVDDETAFAGKSCADVAKELIQLAAKSNRLNDSVKNIIIKLARNSEQPGAHFLETLETAVTAAAQEAKSAAKITVIGADKLDENGYINFETAKELLLIALGVEKIDQYYGLSTPTDDKYICTVEIDGKQTSHSIDAIIGTVADATEDELLGEDIEEEIPEEDYIPEEPEEELPEDIEIEIPEDTTSVVEEGKA